MTGGAQNPLTLNRYLYANANPARFIDPTGHASMDEDVYAYLHPSRNLATLNGGDAISNAALASKRRQKDWAAAAIGNGQDLAGNAALTPRDTTGPCRPSAMART